MKENNKIPPKLAQRLLSVFLRDDLAEEVLGDLDEKFYLITAQRSRYRAKMNYWYQVFNYLRPFAIRKLKTAQLFYYAMFQSYFKIGWRNLVKQKMYSSVKIGGFALGIASCLLIALFIKNELSYDLQYPDKERIYRVIRVDNGEEGYRRGVSFEAPFAKAVKEGYPEVEAAGRLNSSELFGAGSNEVRRADQVENYYEEGFAYADQELLDLFQIPMVYGSREHALAEPGTIVISKSKADKYFPNEDPVGKILVLNNNEKRSFKIGGVMEDFPSTSHLQYHFFITMTEREFWKGEQTFWWSTNYPTYIKLRPGADPAALEKKMMAMIKKYHLPNWIQYGMVDAEKNSKRLSFQLQPLTDVHLRSEGIHDRISNGDIRFVWLFGAIAAFILIIASINFINLSTAKSANRAKEVGLRKVVGSYRGNLIRQFLAESLLFCFFSFVLGVILAWLLLPYFNELAAKSLIFPWKEWWLYPLLAAALVVVGVLSGFYPSLYLSSFKPIQVLKGNVSRGSKSSTTRSFLVVFQFTASIVLIVGTIVIYRQMQFILNTKVGFDKDQVLLIHGANTLGAQNATFKEELLTLPGVKSVAYSDYLPISGTKRNGNGFWMEGKVDTDQPVYGQMWRVDYDYVKTMGMKIVEGRDFSKQVASDSGALIINQKMAKALWQGKALDKQMTNSSEHWTIIGVVKDFHFETMKEDIEPLCMSLGYNSNTVVVKVNTDDMKGLLQSTEKTWKEFAPHQPIRYSFLDDSFALMYEDIQRMGLIFTSFAVLAIIVACLGLFALSAFMVEQRSKEISIRLVLGASVRSVFRLLTQNFLKLVLISFVIAGPIAWYLMVKWLEDYKYKTDITWDVFVLAGTMSMAIALITISYQAIRAGLISPVKSLRSE